MTCHMSLSFKPIFHCDTKFLASGVSVGQCPRHQNFPLEIPTCWYILALANAKICVSPDAKLEPIFHCDVKPFTLGTFASLNAKDSTFALPNAKNTNMLVSLALGDGIFLRYLTQNPQREPVEYRLRWVPNGISCVGHVHFIFVV